MTTTYTRLTFEDRVTIEQGLLLGKSTTEIARELARSQKTVSAEIARNRIVVKRKRHRNSPAENLCAHKQDCTVTRLCNSKWCSRYCARCKNQRCGNLCATYSKSFCPRTTRAPHVCTGCESFSPACSHRQYIYRAKVAQAKAETLARESRTGLNTSAEELAALSELISPLIKRGQPLSHIMSHHKDEIAYSLSSLYRLCEAGYFEFSKMHLTRAIRYKQRKERVKRDPRALPGREYSDFLELDEEAQFSAVQIDTVYGSQGGPTLLTLLLRRPHFMFIFLLESNTQAQVVHALDELEIAYGEVAFKRVFSTLLADRGSEFIDPDVIERGLSGNRRTSVYYCDPCAPWQKGSLERNHEYIRRILPKGTSFEFITKRHCSLLMSHINSAARPGLGGASPLELAPPQLPARVREYFGISLISADDVILNKTLLQDD